MKLNKQYICGVLALMGLMPFQSYAQTVEKVLVDFDQVKPKSIGVYDFWDDSPFNKGLLPQTVANTKEVVNPHKTDSTEANPSNNVLQIQRSRYGGNLFGAKIELTTPFKLSKKEQYVHVLFNRPIQGEVMLIGLGKRDNRPGQSPQTVQFRILGNSRADANTWSDVVFPVKGFSIDSLDKAITINYLVVVPNCESPHNLQQDFLAYVDNIVLNNEPIQRFRKGYYLLNFNGTEQMKRNDRYINNVGFRGNKGSNATINISESERKNMYHNKTSEVIYAFPGETLTPSFSYNGNWMHGYVYVDLQQDGKFTSSIGSDGRPNSNSDLLSYAYYEGKNSSGNTLSNGNPGITPPAFTLPSTLKPGMYRIRYKVDYNNIDAGGNVSSNNHIKNNGGGMVDFTLNVRKEKATVLVKNRNGDILKPNGTAIKDTQIDYNTPLEILLKPAPNFVHNGVVIRHGYNLEGQQVVNGVRQYKVDTIPAYRFRDNKVVIPAEYIDGDIEIEAEFAEDKNKTGKEEDYPVSFSNTDKVNTSVGIELMSVQVNGKTFIKNTTDSKNAYIYADKPELASRVNNVSTINSSLSFKVNNSFQGNLHAYLYIDWNQDGKFTNELDASGVPAKYSELVSFNYYNGKNSLGQEVSNTIKTFSLPAFTTLPLLPQGVYRARLKIDNNNIDPAGSSNIVSSGGRIVDFNIHFGNNTDNKLLLSSLDGNIYNRTGGAPNPTIRNGQNADLKITPVAEGYKLKKLIVSQGYNLHKPQYLHSTAQWWNDSVDVATIQSGLYKKTLNYDTRVNAIFENENAVYQKIFSDEFEGVNNSQADAKKWERSKKAKSTWNRFISDREDVAFLEDGNLVLVAKASEVPGEMVTGAVQTKGKFDFTYGKVECRVKTTAHTGNFPAVWMMPTDQSKGWPSCGEIDIWEQIDTQSTSHHTIHTNWTYTLKNKQGSTFSKYSVQNDRFHTYGLEWTPTDLTWFVDGTKVGTYRKSTNESELSKGQWPFDKAFYLILNQSVGDGSWAKKPDTTFIYSTLVDFIRVYQMKENPASIHQSLNNADLNIHTTSKKLTVEVNKPTDVKIVDLLGRVLTEEKIEVQKTFVLESGIYFVNNKKVLVP